MLMCTLKKLKVMVINKHKKIDQTKRPSLPKKPAPTSGRRWCPASQVDKKSSNGFVHTPPRQSTRRHTEWREEGKEKDHHQQHDSKLKREEPKQKRERERESALSIL